MEVARGLDGRLRAFKQGDVGEDVSIIIDIDLKTLISRALEMFVSSFTCIPALALSSITGSSHEVIHPLTRLCTEYLATSFFSITYFDNKKGEVYNNCKYLEKRDNRYKEKRSLGCSM